jgi:pyridoxine 5-phosphate synthase
VVAIPEVEEVNIGHAIVAQAVYMGIGAAVREMRAALDRARTGF